jgi:hypothetical protein
LDRWPELIAMGHRRGPDEQSSMFGKWYSLPSSPALVPLSAYEEG